MKRAATVPGSGSWLARIDALPRDREALLFEGRVSTFGGLHTNVVSLLERLESGEPVPGFARGERLALLAPPSAAGVVLMHACLEKGIVMVPLNLRWTEDELRFAIRKAGARGLVVSTETRSRGERLAKALGFALIELSEGRDHSAELRVLASPANEEPGEAARESPRSTREEVAALDAALLLFTSGTSGRPKAALLSKANLIASARASAELLGAGPADRWLCCMPLFHIGGLSILVRSVLAGSSVVLHRTFEPAEVSRALDEDRVTVVSFVAAMLSRVLEWREARRAPDALRLVLLGGGPAADSLLERASSQGYPIAPSYGLTEAASQVATRPPVARKSTESKGAGGLIPLPGTDIRVVDDERACLPAGCIGNIEVRGPTVMCGYFEDPQATQAALGDGWLQTGDVGVLDSEGHLAVLDRRADLIVSGGENVYPAEVESVLQAFPGVREVAVTARPDEAFGARPQAFVVREAGAEFEAADLLAFCRERLARFKVPVRVEFLEALPRTASGKVLRRAMTEASENASAKSEAGVTSSD